MCVQHGHTGVSFCDAGLYLLPEVGVCGGGSPVTSYH